jgi:TM2 domain-containing membrane protein YozV
MEDILKYRLDMIEIRNQLTAEQMNLVNSAMQGSKKQPMVMWLLWLFTGTLGGHRYYLGDYSMGIWFTVAWVISILAASEGPWLLCIPLIVAIVDVFFINQRLETFNLLLEINTINYVKGRTDNKSP